MTRLTALRAQGLLAEFSNAGVLTPADVHVAQRLGALVGETDDRVLLAAALTVRGTRSGSVVLDLTEAAATIAPDASFDTDLQSDTDAPPDGDGMSPLPWPELDGWIAACSASRLVTGVAGGPPLQLVGSRLWLDRYWRQEVQVAEDLLRRSQERPEDIDLARLRADLDSLYPDGSAADQRLAVAVAAMSRVAVIAGGPGTGKTTTVAQLITVLLRSRGLGLRIALAAPTGKAAARLEESVHSAASSGRGGLTAADQAALAGLSASTLHRLLGWRPGTSSRFRHDRDNHLPFDVVIVDESSMVALTMMARLLEALAPATRLILVGDPDQLASVEAGAVLGDLVDIDDTGAVTAELRSRLSMVMDGVTDGVTDGVPSGQRGEAPGARLRESVVRLRTVHRFDAGGPIAELAALIRAGRGEDAVALLRSEPEGLRFAEVDDDAPITGAALDDLRSRVLAYETALIGAARTGDDAAALDVLDRHRLLCAHRTGPRGVRRWSELVEQWLSAGDAGVAPRSDGRYAGQPLLVTANDYEIELYNGDTGVVVVRRGNADTGDTGDGDRLAAAFRRGGEPLVLPLVRLGAVRPLHAMTVHRAQGSQFDSVTVLLPMAASPLATRQTLYTAITRAAHAVQLIGSAEALVTCVEREAARATGLRDRLTAPLVSVAERESTSGSDREAGVGSEPGAGGDGGGRSEGAGSAV